MSVSAANLFGLKRSAEYAESPDSSADERPLGISPNGSIPSGHRRCTPRGLWGNPTSSHPPSQRANFVCLSVWPQKVARNPNVYETPGLRERHTRSESGDLFRLAACVVTKLMSHQVEVGT